MWWDKSVSVLPLVTTGPLDAPRAQAGVLDQPGTAVLFGGDNVDPGIRSGGRFTLGYWLNPCCDEGLEATYMFLGSKGASFNETSNGTPLLARPFFNVQTGVQDSLILAYPSQQTAVLAANMTNELDSVEVLYRQSLLRQCGRELDLVMGYRYARFAENLTVNGSTTYIAAVGDIPVNTVMQVNDRFAAANEFNGAELGFVAKTQACRWSLELLGKLALGSSRSRVSIDGSTVVTEPGQSPLTSPGGLLALPTNIGNYQRSNLAVIPELGFNVGYDLTCHLKLTAGYSFLYWSQLARAADQIDTNVNTSQAQGGTLSGAPAPQFRFITNDYWAQGLNFGLDYRF
jgi:hypothetical protein